MTQKKQKYLLAIREHLRDCIEFDRQKLSDMWERGQTENWKYQRIKERWERSQNKLDDINFQICER